MPLTRLVSAAAIAVCALTLHAQPSRQWNLLLGAGASSLNWHGRSVFRSVTVERVVPSERFERFLGKAQFVTALSYSKVHQPRSWFGHQYEPDDDRVRSEWLTVLMRKTWRESSSRAVPFAEIGTGPMWSNRRVPAATSRFNMNSQIAVGAMLLPRAKHPLLVGYRFSHISNGGSASRNPGLNVNSIFAGFALSTTRR